MILPSKRSKKKTKPVFLANHLKKLVKRGWKLQFSSWQTSGALKLMHKNMQISYRIFLAKLNTIVEQVMAQILMVRLKMHDKFKFALKLL